MDNRRIRKLREGRENEGPIVYWMDREQRVLDNWALYTCIRLAKQKSTTVEIVAYLSTKGGTLRQLDFTCKSLREVADTAHALGMPFSLVRGETPVEAIVHLASSRNTKILVTDMSPLREVRSWKSQVAERIEIPFLEVDAHNIVPIWLASPKLEYQAATFRPKINRLLPEFLTQMPEMESYRMGSSLPRCAIDFDEILQNTVTDRSILPVDWIVPGAKAADMALQDFIHA